MKLPRNYKIRYSGSFDSTCDNCGQYTTCNWHHLEFGSNRKKYSDYFDLVKPLCIHCHHRIHHGNTDADSELAEKYRIIGQQQFEREHPEWDFREIFGRSYL